MMSDAALQQRIDELLAIGLRGPNVVDAYAIAAEIMHGTLTLARFLYGDRTETPQVHSIMKAAQFARQDDGIFEENFVRYVSPAVTGALRAMQKDISVGLVGSIQRRATGELIADMVGLAKEALGDGSDGAKNVAAVLAAAAFEDTIRKMGTTLADVQDRPDLQDVVAALKKANVLQGASVSTAVGYLKFRNDALHADWVRLDRAVVAACLAFVEQLLIKHFS